MRRDKVMIVGYSRTSTTVQEAGLEAQARDLLKAGVEKLFTEETSAVGPRPILETALDFVREGDTFTVTKLDRLARSVIDLIKIAKRLEAKHVGLRILDLGIDTTTPSGRLTLNIFGSVAQFEREIMLERQREGIAKAKGEGKYKGRKATARAKTNDILRLATEGMPRDEIATQLGIGTASVYRVLAEAKAKGAIRNVRPRIEFTDTNH
jgi:DNA invertase Pin-like site-specific DNA recombinase